MSTRPADTPVVSGRPQIAIPGQCQARSLERVLRPKRVVPTGLPGAFGRQSFAFFGTVLSGAQKQRDRWKRGVSATNNALGYAVGRLYVERYFPAGEKARAQAMVANIIAAFGNRIDRLDWMAPATNAVVYSRMS